MSAFEVVVTPTRVKNARRKIAAREPTSVVLAPFSAKSVVTFDDIPVTKTARRFLNIFNPSDQDLTVSINHSIDSAFGVQFEWSSNLIPSNKTASLEIVWTPKVEVKTKDTISLIDDRHFKKDVSLIFKSFDQNVNNKAPNVNSKATKPPTLSRTSRNVTGKLKIKSPSPPQGLLRQAMMSKAKPKLTAVAVTNSKSNAFHVTAPMPLSEQNGSSHHNKVSYVDGKENKSPPRSPHSVTALFDDIQFTPVSRPKNSIADVDDIDYMASLPTPVIKQTHDYTYAVTNPSDTMEITSFEPNIASTIGKEVPAMEAMQFTDSDPRRKLFDVTSRSICPGNDTLIVSTGPVMNVTHTIVPTFSLTSITEEKSDCPTIMQDTFKLSPRPEESSTELSTPKLNHQQSSDTLHKKFQSMRNLDDLSVQQKMIRDNQGSMPNLTDIVGVRPLESNRYYYQSIENNVHINGDRHPLNASSVFGGSIMSFKEHDFLAQSSRFNLNESAVDGSNINPNIREFAVPQPIDQHRNKRQMDENGKTKYTSKWSPPKRSKLDSSSSSSTSICSSTQSVRRSCNWSGVKPKKFPYAIPKLNLTRPKQEEERVVFFNPEHHIKSVINPDVFAATTTIDPFLSVTMYLDEECIEKHEMNFKKWLNALVTIPWEVDSDKQPQIDFGKLFNDVRGKDLNMAETKEVVSSHYLTKHRMESLRKTATTLFVSENITAMFQKLYVQIEKGQLKIRDGIDLHLDIVLQRELLQLLLFFNPLWLRISLEVIYGEVINMNHNFDIMSLSRFIVNRMFKNKHLEQKYSKVLPQKSDQLKKFSLKKLFMLLVFLDQAKQNKIVTHNPCLFVKTSPYKETKEILCKVSSLILGNMGDILRDLKRIGIVLKHKQTYIEEFDYAFRNLAVDLRDGVRLTKVMEIILLRDDMVEKLRVPAISRLQRVYNVDLALTALKEANYIIAGGILAADIADGHREKTLSLLWQIIYKFRAPKFNEAAITIQSWWRRSSLKVVIKQRIRAKLLKAKINAATCIQAAYRGHLSRRYTKMWYAKRTSATIILQSHIRRYLAQKEYQRKVNAATYIQQWYKRTCLYNRLRNNYLWQRSSAIIIQRWYRRMILARKIEHFVPIIHSIRNEVMVQNRSATILQTRYRAICLMRLERSNYLKIRSSVIVIQQRFRSFLIMKKERTEYLRIRTTIVTVQRRFRAKLQAKSMSQDFKMKKSAALCIQKYVRATFEARRVRCEYLTLKKSVEVLQTRYRARLEMLKAVQEYEALKHSVIVVQQRFRAHLEMKREFGSFQAKKQAAIILQTQYRSILEMRQQREKYLRIKSAVQVLQMKWKATLLMRKQREDYIKTCMTVIFVQRRVIANRKMVQQRTDFVKLKNAAICVQSHYRAQLQMKEEKSRYHQLRWACIFVQQRYRANRVAVIQQKNYQNLKHHATCIQNRFRANQLMKLERQSYLKLKDATNSIQTLFRATLKMRQARQNYLSLKRAAIFVQRKYRARKAMEIDLENFKLVKWSAKVIQERFRAQLEMKRQRNEYLIQKSSAIKIQRWIRSLKLSRDERLKFSSYRQSVINVQRRYRAKVLMQETRSNYKLLQWAVLLIQRKFRAKRAMHQQQHEFQKLRNAAIAIQRRYRGKLETKQQVVEYQTITKSVKLIQVHFRSYKLMKIHRESFLTLRTATVTIQRLVRSYQLTQTVRKEFMDLRKSTIFVQSLRRANVLMKKESAHYAQLREATIAIQTRYRANVLMKVERGIYERKRKAALVIQQNYRAMRAMKSERNKYLTLKNSVIFCQRLFRANLIMMQQRCSFIVYRTTVIFIQRKYRAILQMRTERTAFELLKKSTILMQRRLRSNILANKQRSEYLRLKQATVFVQRKFRANKAMQTQRTSYLLQKKSVLVLQTHFRAMLLGKSARLQYLRIQSAVLTIQRRFIAFKLMKEKRSNYQQMRQAAIVLQTRYRSYLVMKQSRSNYLQLRNVVINVQTRLRANMAMRVQRTEYLKITRSAVVIQKWYRATMLMKNMTNQYKLIRCLVICIQQRFRAKLAARIERKKFLEVQSAAVVIQQRYRAQQQMILERNNWQTTKSTILGLQTRIRGYLAREEYNRKLTPEAKLQMKQTKCAIKIQSFWRGWVVRKRKGANAVALKKIRSNIQQISRDVHPNKTLKRVLVNYVAVLKKRYNVDEILSVLTKLTKISRMIPHVLINDSVFIVSFCYGIMSQAIRSELDKLVIEKCSYIILNLARYEPTRQNAFQMQGLTTIAQMLLRWCDKDCDIFNTLCSVVYVFCQSPEKTEQIRNFMTLYDAELFTLHEIKRLVKRKENMRKNKTQYNSTPSPLTARQRNQLPMLKPDFGMNSSKPYIFYCSIFAFDTILNNLHITNI